MLVPGLSCRWGGCMLDSPNSPRWDRRMAAETRFDTRSRGSTAFGVAESVGTTSRGGRVG